MHQFYVMTGGEWIRASLNAIAAFMQTRTWHTLFRMGMLLSVLVLALRWVKYHNILDTLWWAFGVVIIGVLTGSTASVQVVDTSQPANVYVVDNVPVGLVIPVSLTAIGHALSVGYDTVFSLPDSLAYSKTGMLFGASLVVKSTDFLSQNPAITGLFQDYVQNCVIGDIMLNHKYSLDDLMHSPDPYTIVFSRPSPLRGVFNDNNQFQTCAEAAVTLKNALALDSESGGKTWSYFVRRIFGGRPDAGVLFSQMLGDSYNYFYASGQNASQIIRQNVTMNALREGIMGYAARNGDTSSLLNIASTSAMEKQRLAQATVGQTALRSLPVMQTVITGMLVGLFPMLIVIGALPGVTTEVLKMYVMLFVWLQTWPLVFAILNHAMNFRMAHFGTAVTLSNLSTVQENYADISSLAGYLCITIVTLTGAMLPMLARGVDSAVSAWSGSTSSTATSSGVSSADANYTYNNMQSDNVNGFHWNTNSTTAMGQITEQLGNGASVTQTRDGSMVVDSRGGISSLPVSINVAHQTASAQQQMAREAQSEAETASQGYSRNLSSGWSQLSQLGTQRGSSDTLTSGTDSTTSSDVSRGAAMMLNATHALAQSEHISESEANQALFEQSQRGSTGLGGSVRAKVDTSKTLWGKPGEWMTGASFAGEASAKADYAWGRTHSNGISDRDSRSTDNRDDHSAQALKDYREGLSLVTSHRETESGSHSDNNARSRLDQLASTFSAAKSQFAQFATSQTRSHEYAEMASRTESLSGESRENLDQQFANFVQQHSPQNALQILSDTASPEVATERNALVKAFVQSQVEPQMNGAYEAGRASIGETMGTVSGPGGAGDVARDHQQHQATIEARTDAAGIRQDVGAEVVSRQRGNHNSITKNRDNIASKEKQVHDESQPLQQGFDAARNKHNQATKTEREKSEHFLSSTPTEMTEQAQKLMDEQKRNKK
jgi:conjugal transfer mating pair stabilization protein TraG